MKGATAVLRQPESTPESRLPAEVQPLHRPPALGRAVELAFLRWEKRRLAPTEGFWRDFGFHIVSATPQRLVARGAGTAPCIAIAEFGRQDRFVGPAFMMSADTELQRYVEQMGARWLAPERLPAGGRGVELFDPSGRSVWLLQDQRRVEPLPLRETVTPSTNTAQDTRRVNRTVRTPIEPARIVRLGHMVLQTVDFARMADWYLRVLGLIPTDVQYLADGSPSLAFCRLDLGRQPADHHTLVIVGGIEEKVEHSAYEVLDLDALGQGQQVLRAQGHRHMWGIGRHLLGSQLFDYWLDPDGFEYEHYTDGDVFTADVETAYSPLEFGGIWAWGDDAPASMKPRKSLRTLLHVLKLVRRKAITPQRLKLLSAALDAPARPWL
ncbi:VOC family protein [Rivibacter subsaxonicus]|uniref:Glyoxalase/bleomycin resistance protein/dioxygenase superfamily protein n=1 Tax=Rivibacter subsaxonicus TaxID=457575 RepID=A0A4Q7VN72_9BURK|nr:VOC family protein [Rivibacter subsaxonicus]RZT97793.1 glyoxalase/bleomycin resistance protein/dioxygenase superfamily protein [Rivibacter subsaxonicus]